MLDRFLLLAESRLLSVVQAPVLPDHEDMHQRTLVEPVVLEIGTMPRGRLLRALRQRDIQLNESAVTLLADRVFDLSAPESVVLVERSVGDLGLTSGAVLAQIFGTAYELGLRLCPPTTAPYLRLALDCQPSAPDSVLSNGSAPSGSLTVAANPRHADEDFPKGFYLRVISDRPWLRGYHCSSEHVWDPEARFVFRWPSRSHGPGCRTPGDTASPAEGNYCLP